MILDVKDYVRQVTNRWIMGKHSMRQLANMSINNTMFQPITVYIYIYILYIIIRCIGAV